MSLWKSGIEMEDNKSDHHEPSNHLENQIHQQKSHSQATQDFRNLAHQESQSQDPQVVNNSMNNNCPIKTASTQGSNPCIIFQELVEEVKEVNVHDPDFHISIDRDYSGKLNGDPMKTRFFTHFPIILEPLISKEEFEKTVEEVNSCFDKAESRRWEITLESILSYLTCSLMNLCRPTLIEKAMEELGIFLYEENDRVYHPMGLHVVHPMARGLRRIVIRSIGHYDLYQSMGKSS